MNGITINFIYTMFFCLASNRCAKMQKQRKKRELKYEHTIVHANISYVKIAIMHSLQHKLKRKKNVFLFCSQILIHSYFSLSSVNDISHQVSIRFDSFIKLFPTQCECYNCEHVILMFVVFYIILFLPRIQTNDLSVIEQC